MLKCQKNLFSLDENVHYLNCAYKSPLLKNGEEMAKKALLNERNPFNLKPHSYFEISDKIRIEFSKIIHCHKNEIALFPSTSYGFANVFNNLKVTRVKAITVENEFPSGFFSIKKWGLENEIMLQTLTRNELSAKDWNQKILDSINNETNVVFMSSVHWMDGTKFDIKKIGKKCKSVGAYFIVDGTQSVGAMNINVKEFNIDALICAGYKWLFGPYSMALGYFSSKFNNGTPIEESWMNRTNAEEFSNLTDYDSKYKTMAGRYNVGETANFVLSPIMLNGLKQLNNWGIYNIESYCKKLADPLLKKLIPIGIKFEEKNYFNPHLFSLGLPDYIDNLNFKKILDNKNIYISLRGKNIRVSINVFNNQNDINMLIEAVKSVLK